MKSIRPASAAKALDEQRERWLNPAERLEPLAAKIDAAHDIADVPTAARPLVRRSAILAAAAKDARQEPGNGDDEARQRAPDLAPFGKLRTGRLAHQQLDRVVLALPDASRDAEPGFGPQRQVEAMLDAFTRLLGGSRPGANNFLCDFA